MVRYPRISLGLHIRIGEAEDVSKGGKTSARDTLETDSPPRGDGVLGNGIADLERIGARESHRERNRDAGLNRVEQIGAASTPPRQSRLVRDRCLPLCDLVGMREELRRSMGWSRVVLGFGQRVSECAGVEQDGEPALAEEVLQLTAGGVQSVAMAVAVRRRDG